MVWEASICSRILLLQLKNLIQSCLAIQGYLSAFRVFRIGSRKTHSTSGGSRDTVTNFFHVSPQAYPRILEYRQKKRAMWNERIPSIHQKLYNEELSTPTAPRPLKTTPMLSCSTCKILTLVKTFFALNRFSQLKAAYLFQSFFSPKPHRIICWGFFLTHNALTALLFRVVDRNDRKWIEWYQTSFQRCSWYIAGKQ